MQGSVPNYIVIEVGKRDPRMRSLRSNWLRSAYGDAEPVWLGEYGSAEAAMTRALKLCPPDRRCWPQDVDCGPQAPARALTPTQVFFGSCRPAARNRDYALGLVAGNPLLLAAGTIAVLVIVAIWQRSSSRPWPWWIVPLLTAGAVSNLIDRLVLGAVRDFIPIFWIVFQRGRRPRSRSLSSVSPATASGAAGRPRLRPD